MESASNFSRNQVIDLLIKGTLYKRVRWTRVTDYLFYNGRNKALVNFVDAFSTVKTPQIIDDIPQIDIMKSYYCEYEGAAFCLMFFTQVLEEGEGATNFYYLMVQRHPYDNFGYYTTPEESDKPSIKALLSMIELQIEVLRVDSTPFNKALSKLREEILSFNPETEEVLAPLPPPPPHKHCCVIDENNNYVEFVLVLIKVDEHGVECEEIQGYTLKSNEHLIDAKPPALSDPEKIHWNGTDWE